MFSPEDELEPVFDLGLCASIDKVGDLPPPVANLQPLLKEVYILFETPLLFVDRRV